EEMDIPADMADDAEEARMLLIEAAAEGDDELLDKYFEEETLSNEEIIQGLKGAMRQGTAVPVFYAAGQEGIGVRPLLDTAVQLFPAPSDLEFRALNKNDEEETYPVADNSPLAAFVFKTREDPYGKLSYLRVYGGTLQSDSRVWDVN